MPLGAYSDSHSNARKIIGWNNSCAIVDCTVEFGYAGDDNIAWWKVVTLVQWQELNSKEFIHGDHLWHTHIIPPIT